MLVKSLAIILTLFNPLTFLVSQPAISPLLGSDVCSEEPENNLLEWEGSLISALGSTNPNFLPIRDWNIGEPELAAKAALIFNPDKDKILYQKNIDQVLPIASLTKLMTALIVLENLNLGEIIVVSEKAIAAYGDKAELIVDERLSVKNLLHALLMESSNDAAVALAEAVEQRTGRSFIDLMSKKAEELELSSTHFVDASGYDPANVSTVREVAQLVKYSFNQPLVWQILKTPTINLSSIDGKVNHRWVNTDELLNRLPNIIGGKTGYTEEAQGCLVLVIKQTSSENLITVVLGAQQRFLETERLIHWVKKAYKW